MEEELKPLTLNKSLEMNEEYKKIITSAEGGRYEYYDYSKEIIQEIANKDAEQLYCKDAMAIVQALFPQYLICSGLFDNFLMFEIKNNNRIDPPKYYYLDACSYLNNDKDAKYNFLLKEMIDLFNKNDIKPNESWIKLLEKTKEKNSEGE